MKVLIAAQGTSLDSPVAKRFGHAPYGIRVFITGNIGPHAFRLIDSLGRKVALARNVTARAALEKLQRGDLEILTGPTLKRSVHDHPHHQG